MVTPLVIIGAGGFGREVLDICDACNAVRPTYDVLGFVEDPLADPAGTLINDKPIVGDYAWLARHVPAVQAVCAVGTPQVRRKLVLRAAELGCTFANVIHPAALLTRWVTLGQGVVIAAGNVLTNQIRIGDHVHLNLACTVGHDAVFEDYATVAPGVHISGNVTLGEGCYVGTGANIIQGLRVGAWSVVGAGSVLIKEVPANSTVVGVPGQVIKTREAGWHLA